MSAALTVIELLDSATQEIVRRRSRSPHSGARENYDQAITHIEDAQMRYTRGRAMAEGKFNPTDLDRRVA